MDIRPTDPVKNQAAPQAQPKSPTHSPAAVLIAGDSAVVGDANASPAALRAALDGAGSVDAIAQIAGAASRIVAPGAREVLVAAYLKAAAVAGPQDFGKLVAVAANYNAYGRRSDAPADEVDAAATRLIALAPNKLEAARLVAWFRSCGDLAWTAKAERAVDGKPAGGVGVWMTYQREKLMGADARVDRLFQAYVRK